MQKLKTVEASPTEEEPTVAFIHQLAREGLSKLGHAYRWGDNDVNWMLNDFLNEHRCAAER